MTMHLLPPMYSTTGHKKAKKKFASAAQKRESEQLERDWQNLQSKYTPSVTNRSKPIPVKSFMPTIPAGRGTNHIPSKSTGVGVATKADIPQYTGTKMLGIAVQHKSCLQPVFSENEAKDSATMRRG